MDLSVLHSPVNVAGGPGALSKGLKKLGADSLMMVFNEHRFDYGADVDLGLVPSGTRRALMHNLPLQWRALMYSARRFEVYHFHGGLMMFPKTRCVPFLRKKEKKIVMQWWGSDIRDKQPEDVDYVMSNVDAAIVGSFATLKRAPRKEGWPDYDVLPPAIDLDDWQPSTLAPMQGGVLRVAHAPSSRDVKGTKIVLDVINQLKSDVSMIELDLIENLPHDEARKRYMMADVIIDQLKIGWYGLLSIEAMSLGKPVICFIDDEAAAKTEEEFGTPLPIIRADESTLAITLQSLLLAPETIPRLGALSRRYVETVHSDVEVAKRALKIYQRIGAAGVEIPEALTVA
jgi:glycosyltransferase involved in cell wall biosynthesis